MTPNQTLLTEAYAAFNRRDIDAILALMAPDVDWPNAAEGTRVHGHDKVRAYWTLQWSMVDPTVDPIRFEELETGRARVEVHQVVRDLSGKLLADQIVQHMYQIEAGLIQRMDIQSAEPRPTS